MKEADSHERRALFWVAPIAAKFSGARSAGQDRAAASGASGVLTRASTPVSSRSERRRTRMVRKADCENSSPTRAPRTPPLETFWMAFRVVQPWGQDKVRQSTWLSEHETAEAAFREIDRLASEMSRTGVPSDAIELVVLDVDGKRIVSRNHSH
jgi:hypothetical protein